MEYMLKAIRPFAGVDDATWLMVENHVAEHGFTGAAGNIVREAVAKASRSEAGRKAALARWGSRSPESDSAKLGVSEGGGMANPAKKADINRIIEPIDPSGRFRIAAQGTTELILSSGRIPMKMGTRPTSRTAFTRNGHFRVTVWGRNPEAKIESMAQALTDNGFKVSNKGADSLEVNNGNVAPLEGVLRFEGTY